MLKNAISSTIRYRLCAILAILLTAPVAMVFAGPPINKNSILHFENQNKAIKHLDFKDEDDLQPVNSSFSLLEYSLMSNEKGERWALITVKNNSGKKQPISDDNFVAVFADGKRTHANNFYELVEPGARLTASIFFGRSNFPIILVTMDSLP